MTEPITPNPGIHQNPKQTTSSLITTPANAGALWTALSDDLLAQVLFAIAGIDIGGYEPFAGLKLWADNLETQANTIINSITNSVTGGNATGPASASAVYPAMLAIPHQNVTIPANPGSGTITHDANASATHYAGAGSSTITLGPWNITPGATANYITVRVGFYASGTTYNTVTCAGVQMQLLEQAISPSGHTVTQTYGLSGPTTGVANAIDVTLNCPFGDVYIAAATADTYIGVGSVTPTTSNTGTNSSPSLTAASATNDYIIHTAIVESNTSAETLTVTAPTGYTTQYNSGFLSSALIGVAFLAGDAAGASSVSFADTASGTASNEWATCAVNLIPLSAAVIGSTFEVMNNSSTAVSANGGNNLFPNSFYNTTVSRSNDLTYSTTGNTVTITQAGTYTITVASLLVSTFVSQWVGMNLVYTPNGGSPVTYRGNTTYIAGSSSTTVVSASFQQYCNAGDTLQPGYYTSLSIAGNTFAGDSGGGSTYFKVALGNRGLLA